MPRFCFSSFQPVVKQPLSSKAVQIPLLKCFFTRARNAFAFVIGTRATADTRETASAGHAFFRAFCFYLLGKSRAVLIDAGRVITAATADIFNFAIARGLAAEIHFTRFATGRLFLDQGIICRGIGFFFGGHLGWRFGSLDVARVL
jgi:hypothetical protein